MHMHIVLAMASSTPSLDRRAWGALLVLCGALFLDGLDVSMLGVALPSIDADLHLGTSTLQWVVSAYVLGYGGLLLLGGRAADLLGRRRVFLAALAVFAAASLLGGLVSDGTLLIATRFIKGVAAAFTAPAGLSIITTSFAEGPARNRALAIYSATGASGFSLGLVLGGLLTTIGWRWTFLLPAPIALALLFSGRRLIALDPPRIPVPGGLRGYDLPGALTISSGMLLLVLSVVRAPQAGWTAPVTLGGFAVAAALLAAFVLVEQRSDHPLVRLGIFRTPGIVRANLTAMAVFGCYVSFQFIATLYLQDALGWSALVMAMALLPAGLIVAFGAPHTNKLIDRVGTSGTAVIGMVAFVAGYALFLRVGPTLSYPAVLLPTMVLLGLGFALCFPAVNVAATTGVADEEQGLASGLVNTSFQVGGALMLAIVTAVITSGTAASTAASGSVDALLDGYVPGLTFITAASGVGLAVALTGLVRRRRAAVAEVLEACEEVVAGAAAPAVIREAA
jgi:MFS family permease